MSEFLREYYYGSMIPSEKCSWMNKEYKELEEEISAKKEKLLYELDENEVPVFIEMIDLIEKLIETNMRESYIEGFKAGARMIMEIHNEK